MVTVPLLFVRDLRVSFPARDGTRTNVVDGVSFDMGREKLGIVGESGSGKSLTGRAILRLIRSPGRVEAARLAFEGEELLTLPERRMRALRGGRIAMVMQDPRYALNPVMTVGRQIAESLRVHARPGRAPGRAATRARVVEMLRAVRIDDPARVAAMYPHELSGGMGQRVMIAMMLIPRPGLLIADEPTSALDVSVQAQVLGVMDDLVRENGMGLILISHDLDLVARHCDRILVMNAGRVVETCEARRLHEARHPYTRGLLAAVPRMRETRAELPTLDRRAWAGT